MKQVRVYDKDGNMIVCWPETAQKLIRLGYSADEPKKKGKSQKPKSLTQLQLTEIKSWQHMQDQKD